MVPEVCKCFRSSQVISLCRQREGPLLRNNKVAQVKVPQVSWHICWSEQVWHPISFFAMMNIKLGLSCCFFFFQKHPKLITEQYLSNKVIFLHLWSNWAKISFTNWTHYSPLDCLKELRIAYSEKKLKSKSLRKS